LWFSLSTCHFFFVVADVVAFPESQRLARRFLDTLDFCSFSFRLRSAKRSKPNNDDDDEDDDDKDDDVNDKPDLVFDIPSSKLWSP
jgi:hypothetical protein